MPKMNKMWWFAFVSIVLDLFSSIARAEPSACTAIVKSLPASGTAMPAEKILTTIAQLSHGVLKLPAKTANGLFLESKIVGSLRCQRNALYRDSSEGRSEVPLPAGYQGGEGELCAGEEVTLAEVSGVTALVRIKPGQTKMTYEIILEQNSEWGSPCMLSIDYVSEYGVEQKSCSGEFCKPFSEAAIRLANTYGSNTDYERAFDAASFSSENQIIWAKMLRAAELQELEWKDAPISSLEGTPNSYYRFKKRLFLPILVDNHLFLANLGTAGFGAGISYWGPLLSVYALDGDILVPVAGFHLNIVGLKLISAKAISEPYPHRKTRN